MPDISKFFPTISVVSHGHSGMLRQLLDDIASHDSLHGVRVVVTLNIPEPNFESSDWPTLDLVVLRNAFPKGFGANHNAAFAYCNTDTFAVLNPDIRLPRNPFPLIANCLEIDQTVGVAAPHVVDLQGRPEDSVRNNLTPAALLSRILQRSLGRERLTGLDADRPLPSFFWVGGMFMVFGSKAFRAIGGFDERFFLYCEDYDICARLRRVGWRIAIVPEAIVVHDAQRHSLRSWRHLRWHLSSLAKVWKSSVFWWTLGAHRRTCSPPVKGSEGNPEALARLRRRFRTHRN